MLWQFSFNSSDKALEFWNSPPQHTWFHTHVRSAYAYSRDREKKPIPHAFTFAAPRYTSCMCMYRTALCGLGRGAAVVVLVWLPAVSVNKISGILTPHLEGEKAEIKIAQKNQNSGFPLNSGALTALDDGDIEVGRMAFIWPKMADGRSRMSDFGNWNVRGSRVDHGWHVYEVWTNLDE